MCVICCLVVVPCTYQLTYTINLQVALTLGGAYDRGVTYRSIQGHLIYCGERRCAAAAAV